MEQSNIHGQRHYDAFISYRHEEFDSKVAAYIHKGLEAFRVPRALNRDGMRYSIKRVFRDQEELPTSPDLSRSIADALANSRYLIVVCSPSTPVSKWVEKEVEYFIKEGRTDRIILVHMDGELENSIPHPLRNVDLAGIPIIDIRSSNTKQSLGILKYEIAGIAAVVLGLSKDELSKALHTRSIVRAVSSSLVIIMVLVVYSINGYAEWIKAEEAHKTALQELNRASREWNIAKSDRDRLLGFLQNITFGMGLVLKDYPEAQLTLLDIYSDNLSVIEKVESEIGDSKSLRKARIYKCEYYRQIGLIWNRKGDYDKAIQYYSKGLELAKELGKESDDIDIKDIEADILLSKVNAVLKSESKDKQGSLYNVVNDLIQCANLSQSIADSAASMDMTLNSLKRYVNACALGSIYLYEEGYYRQAAVLNKAAFAKCRDGRIPIAKEVKEIVMKTGVKIHSAMSDKGGAEKYIKALTEFTGRDKKHDAETATVVLEDDPGDLSEALNGLPR